MTLYALDKSHRKFVAECYKHGGYSDAVAAHETQRVFEINLASGQAYYFVGPDYRKPRYFIGAFVDSNGRATLDANTIGQLGSGIYRDATAWLDYLLNEVVLLEANVWVADLKKEWLLRALGFSKGGVVPDKVDIPGQGPQPALLMYIRKKEFEKVTPETFRATLAKYKAHVKNLELKRVS